VPNHKGIRSDVVKGVVQAHVIRTSVFVALRSAPAAKRICATFLYPKSAAVCIGVLPCRPLSQRLCHGKQWPRCEKVLDRIWARAQKGCSCGRPGWLRWARDTKVENGGVRAVDAHLL